jgi:hypothetical protein
VVTALAFAIGLLSPGFVVNSWSHLELSRTVFTDFYRLNTIRNLDTSSPYSQAFPPLWSVIIAIFRRVADLGIYTGYFLNFPVCLGLLAALMLLFRRIDLPEWAGAACYLSLFGFAPFQGEALGARTIPLSLALITGALAVLFRERLSLPRAALAGLLTGLACLTRFDALTPACAIGLAFAVRSWRMERKIGRAAAIAAIYFVVLGATLSPMIAYGMKHFGKVFPSDNTRMVLQAKGGGVLDYYKTPPAPDLFRRPGKWIAGLVLYKARIIAHLGLSIPGPENQSALLMLMAIIPVIWKPPQLSAASRQFIVLALLLIPVMLLPSVLGGILDSRYYSGPVLLLFAMLFVLLASITRGAWNARRAGWLLLAAAAPLYPLFLQPTMLFRHDPVSLKTVLAPLSPTPRMQMLTDAVRRDSAGGPHRLLFTDSGIAAAKYGALTGEPVIMIPVLVSGTFADFARDWHITHVYEGTLERAVWEASQRANTDFVDKINSSGVVLVPLDLPGLYRVQLGDGPPHS